MECIEHNRLCTHMKDFRSSQASISINYCTELSKTQFFPASIVKYLFREIEEKNMILLVYTKNVKRPCLNKSLEP